MKNTLHIIGDTGCHHAYLNVSLDEAKARYRQATGDDRREFSDEAESKSYCISIRTIEFEDEFMVYDAWSSE